MKVTLDVIDLLGANKSKIYITFDVNISKKLSLPFSAINNILYHDNLLAPYISIGVWCISLKLSRLGHICMKLEWGTTTITTILAF